MDNPPRPRTLARTLRLAFVPVVLALAAAGCSSNDSAPSDDEYAIASGDALTSEEAALGASWNGVEEDFFTPEEQALIGADGDPSGDVEPAAEELGPGALHPLSTCSRTTGYNKGKVMSICAVTIDGKAVEQGTADSYMKMRAAAARAGVGIIVVSGFRTMQKQRELYAAYKAGRGNLAAPPGYSNHQSGHALDLNTKGKGVRAWLVKNAATFGFRRTVPSEDWHYEKW